MAPSLLLLYNYLRVSLEPYYSLFIKNIYKSANEEHCSPMLFLQNFLYTFQSIVVVFLFFFPTVPSEKFSQWL